MRINSCIFLFMFSVSAIAQEYNTYLQGSIKDEAITRVRLITYDLVKGEKNHSVKVKNGEFSLRFEQHYAHDNLLIIGKDHVRFFSAPGDTIDIRYQNKKHIEFKGDHKTLNHEIQLFSFQKVYPWVKIDYENLDVTRHKEESIENLQIFLRYLGKYNQRNHTSWEFRTWARYHAVFEWLFLLTNDINLWMYYNKRAAPNHYFDFLNSLNSLTKSENQLNQDDKKLDIPDNAFLSSHVLRFAESYFSYLFTTNKIKDSQKKSKEELFELALWLMAENTSGKIKEAMVGNLYYQLIKLKEHGLVRQYLPFFNQYVQDSTIRNRIISESKVLAEELASSEIPVEAYLNSVQSDQEGDGLLASISAENKGNVIYIDFWATWCGPCLAEMPASHSLQKKYQKDEISFVYLCYPTEEATWKSTISDLKLTGQHYLLSKEQYSDLTEIFQIQGVPHYVLIDQHGVIINSDAPSPGSGDLEEIINGYLRED